MLIFFIAVSSYFAISLATMIAFIKIDWLNTVVGDDPIAKNDMTYVKILGFTWPLTWSFWIILILYKKLKNIKALENLLLKILETK